MASAQQSRTRPAGPRSGLSRTLITMELLDTATRLFGEKGYEATTLADIASELSISRPALYNYVNSKEDLLAMLVEQVTDRFAEVLTQMRSRKDMSPGEKVADVVALIVRQRAEHPDQFRILDRSEPVLPPVLAKKHLAAKRSILAQFTDLIQAGVDCGEFRRIDARTTALSVLGMCNWVAWWFRPGSEVEAVVNTLCDLVATMLAAGDGPRSRQNQRTIAQIRDLVDRLEG